jgi:hypothetical protein
MPADDAGRLDENEDPVPIRPDAPEPYPEDAIDKSVDWIWIDDYDFLASQRFTFMVPWIMPRGNSLGHTRINFQKAVAHGLTFRPFAVTVKDTLDWWASDAVPAERRANPKFVITREREAQIVAAWKAKKG